MPTLTDFTTLINSLLPEPHASLLSGMLFGVRRSMPSNFYDNLITTGTLHVIALSGQNIAIIMNLVAAISLRFVSRRISGLLTIVFIILFILFVGIEPPVVRAGLMGGLSLIAVYFGKMNWSLLTLFVASAIMVLVRPDWLSSVSFQLSFAASLGIILFGNTTKYTKRVPNAPPQNNSYTPAKHSYSNHSRSIWTLITHPIKTDLRLTLAAQVFTVPIILIRFHRVSLISPIANILIGWVVPLITVGGLGLVLLAWLFFPFAILPSWMLWVPLTYFIEVVNVLAQIPFASLQL